MSVSSSGRFASTSAAAVMKAIECHGGQCAVNASRAVPVPKKEEVLLRVMYTGVNRADLMQKAGKYAPPPGASDVLGLEAVGRVEAYGEGTEDVARRFPVGSDAMCIVSGGGNAEYVATNATHLVPLPKGLPMSEIAAIPETWMTAYQLLFFIGNITDKDTVLIHAAASGVGTSAIQLCRALAPGARIIAVAGADRKLEAVKELGAHNGVNYKTSPDWAKEVLSFAPNGVDLILDPVGGSHWRGNAEAAAMDARWVFFGSMGGVNVDGGFFAPVLRKRLNLVGTTLRNRDHGYKARLAQSFAEKVIPLFEQGKIRAVVDREYEGLESIPEAHARMATNDTIGKLVVKVWEPEAKLQ